MTTFNLSLPDSLKDFVEEQTARGGFPSPGDYIRSLLREAQAHRDRAELEAKLVAALDSEPEEMGRADWDRLRERVRQAAPRG